MENMCAIFVDVDAFDVFAIYISADVRAFVYYQTSFAGLLCPIGKDGTEQAGADN